MDQIKRSPEKIDSVKNRYKAALAGVAVGLSTLACAPLDFLISSDPDYSFA